LGLAVATLGIAVGLAGAMVPTRFLPTLLFEVSPTDGSGELCFARRVSGIDLARTLRTE
jgi:hypothetical protein